MWIYFFYNSTIYLAAMASRNRAISIGVFISYIFFVGLRYETGTDWQVYKPNFYALAERYDLAEFWTASIQYGQEPAFVFLNSLFSKVLPEFEYFQLFISTVFIFSFYKVAAIFGSKNVPLAFAICSSYLWMNVEFSVLRQSLAMAFFHFGMIFFIKNRQYFGIVLFALAFMTHFSSAIYIAIFLLAWKQMRQASFLMILVVAALGFLALMASGILESLMPELAKSKVDYYASRVVSSMLDIDNMFIAAIFVFGIFISFKLVNTSQTLPRTQTLLIRFTIGLGIVGLAGTVVPVFRDRVSYEFLIMLAILATSASHGWIKHARTLIFSWGFLFSLYRVMFTLMIPYEPYQNYMIYSLLGLESTGEERMWQFLGYGGNLR